MKKFIAFVFIIFLFASSSSYALDFIKFGTGHDNDFWGSADNEFGPPFPSTVEFLQQRDKNQLTSVELTDQNVQDAFDGDFGPFDAIVVSESIGEGREEEILLDLKALVNLSPQSYALINQFVSGGGCLILTGDHGEGEEEFLNTAFGYNINIVTTVDQSDTFSIQTGAIGTSFAGGPGILVAADVTTVFSNTPGEIIYSGELGVTVFTDQFGSGTVNAIGWDYCCTDGGEEGPSNTESEILAWYEVVNSAFDQCSPRVSNVPTLSEWGLISMAGILGIVGFMVMRRKKVTA